MLRKTIVLHFEVYLLDRAKADNPARMLFCGGHGYRVVGSDAEAEAVYGRVRDRASAALKSIVLEELGIPPVGQD